MNQPIIIRVREGGQTYTASGGGQRASCSHSRRVAAQHCAEKVLGGSAELHHVDLTEREQAKGYVCAYRAIPTH